MEYINYKQFKEKAICGDVNIPAQTVFQSVGGMIYHEGKPLCFVTSANAHNFFARNDDGCGMKRGELVDTIKETLALQDEHTYERWYRVFNSPVCKQFDNNQNGDTWEWNVAFYNASIATLQYIADLVTDDNWLGIEPIYIDEEE